MAYYLTFAIYLPINNVTRHISDWNACGFGLSKANRLFL